MIEELRGKVNAAEPALQFEFPGVLGDLIGDLTWSPNPVEIKIFSTDTQLLKDKAAEIAQVIETIPGVVDVNDGLVVAGPSLRLKTNVAEAARVGLTPRTLGGDIQAAMIGTVSSYVLHGDRIYNVRVMAAPQSHATSTGAGDAAAADDLRGESHRRRRGEDRARAGHPGNAPRRLAAIGRRIGPLRKYRHGARHQRNQTGIGSKGAASARGQHRVRRALSAAARVVPQPDDGVVDGSGAGVRRADFGIQGVP